jgi:hypothetical protein
MLCLDKKLAVRWVNRFLDKSFAFRQEITRFRKKVGDFGTTCTKRIKLLNCSGCLVLNNEVAILVNVMCLREL